MTSTNYNVGFEGRISSRVLKPPGGGHSDIFGVTEGEQPNKGKGRHQNSSNSISDCFRMEESVTKTVTTETIEKIVEEKTETITEQNGNTETTTSTTVEKIENGKVDTTDKIENGKNEENIKPEENKNEVKVEQNGKTVAPQRVRVPPGGFSSGFW